MRRTKIVCTLGPATDSVEKIKELILNGLDAARINFSHGDHQSHTVTVNMLKQAREELGAPIPLILDTKGPEIRIKKFKTDEVELKTGGSFTITTRDIEGDESIVSVTYAGLPGDLEKGNRVLIDDGLVELEVLSLNDTDIECRIINGGVLSANKGVNIPDAKINLPSLTERDINDIKFGIKMDFDYIAASFIRCAADVIKIRNVLEQNGGGHIHIISKIENREGVDNIDEILEVSDGIMVARGDLGVEIPIEEVPLVQKMLIKKANRSSKLVITATQMLESMINNPRPTRAEANDVANAIFDGSDAIMLSGETAKGDYPVESVATMARIAEKIESTIDYIKKLSVKPEKFMINTTNAISYAACSVAAELKTACIATVTKSGFTAKMISKFKPVCPVAASTYDSVVYRQLNLVWGCKPVLADRIGDDNDIYDLAVETAVKAGLAKEGDSVVIAVGVPVGISGTTNTIRVEMVGDIICEGVGVGTKSATGIARVVKTLEEAERVFRPGDIMVAEATTNELLPIMKKAAAIVVGPVANEGNNHAEIVGRTLDIPVILCNAKITNIIKDSSVITVDAARGFIHEGLPDE
ncbi:MAG: pyruvate kinase [Firmicutes bacterium]|nr:pyruvate kinase [Bacillota bacterium]